MTLADWLTEQDGRCHGCGFHVASQGCRCPGSDWDVFVRALKDCAKNGVVHQNDVRPRLRGRINPKTIGPLYVKAQREGFMTQIGKEPSRDTQGRNTHHESGIYELRSAA